jgi:hypothetical protein
MRTCVERLIALPLIDSITLQNEIRFLETTLESLRDASVISSDAFLDGGAIQGGLSTLSNMVDLGIDRSEAQDHLRGLLVRGIKLDEAHPGLDEAVESSR